MSEWRRPQAQAAQWSWLRKWRFRLGAHVAVLGLRLMGDCAQRRHLLRAWDTFLTRSEAGLAKEG